LAALTIFVFLLDDGRRDRAAHSQRVRRRDLHLNIYPQKGANAAAVDEGPISPMAGLTRMVREARRFFGIRQLQ
jgi:hypothetical protein